MKRLFLVAFFIAAGAFSLTSQTHDKYSEVNDIITQCRIDLKLADITIERVRDSLNQ